ncbi:MAG: FAD:protein FMN transferase [Pseudomonadota bacterium]
MTSHASQSINIEHRADYWLGRFQAMASPCEILLEIDDAKLARRLTQLAADEAWRIERSFSRYRDDNIIHRINHSHGQPVQVDVETAQLLDFAYQCYELSEGLFDITSGVLRKIWKFDGSDRVPDAKQVKAMLPHIGLNKARWQAPYFTLPEGMEIDLGGIAKEYAVDRTLLLLQQQSNASMVVNYGGDMHCSGPRANGQPWTVGIEDPSREDHPLRLLQIRHGALATSGDARRYLMKNGKRYSHILNPKTGWPVEHAPRSVTVAGASCTEAGILSTLAMLQGKEAEAFLDAQGVQYWCVR